MFGLRINIYADDGMYGVTYQLHGRRSIMYKHWFSGSEDKAEYMPGPDTFMAYV